MIIKSRGCELLLFFLASKIKPGHGVFCRQPKQHQWPQKSLFQRRTKWVELIKKNGDATSNTLKTGVEPAKSGVFLCKNLGLIWD